MKKMNPGLLVAALGLVASFVTSPLRADTMSPSTSPEGARVYIISPTDGEMVGSEVLVKFGLQGMGVAPAGTNKENTGHHHLLVDVEKLPDMGKSMGKDVMHFGGGQTEKLIKLEKGKHTLQMILGNYLHIPHDPPVVSEKITINVE